MSGDNETVKRIIAKVSQFIKPGQIDFGIIFGWITDRPEESQLGFDGIVSGSDKRITNEPVAESSSSGKSVGSGVFLGEVPEDVNSDEKHVLDSPLSPVKASLNNLEICSGTSDDVMINNLNAKQQTRRRRRICKYFREGICRNGKSCAFSHDAEDSNRTPKLCKDYIFGKCRKGLHCAFWHGEHPCKDYVFGRCHSKKCRFSHLPLTDFTRSVFEKTLKDEEKDGSNASSPYGFSRENYPRRLPAKSFSSSSDHKMRRDRGFLASNKKTYRHNASPYSKMPSQSKPISLRNISTTDLLSDVAFDLTRMPRRRH